MPVLRDHMQPFDLQPPMQICVARHFGTLLNLVGGLWGGWQGVMGKGGQGEVFASADICQAGICPCRHLSCSTSRYQPGGWAVRKGPGPVAGFVCGLCFHPSNAVLPGPPTQPNSQIKSDMSSSDQPLFYGCFRHLAARSDLELRQACASQLAAVVRAASTLSASAYQSHFHDTATLLAGDDADSVRASVAEQLNELARLAGKDAGARVRPRVLEWGRRRA